MILETLWRRRSRYGIVEGYFELAEGMNRESLLPGVTTSAVPPAVVCDTRREIARARRRALACDVLQIALLVVVDTLFARWPSAHIPGLERETSLGIVRMLNMALIAHLWLERALPRWTARRIATTWCRSEKQRFFDREI